MHQSAAVAAVEYNDLCHTAEAELGCPMSIRAVAVPLKIILLKYGDWRYVTLGPA